MENSFEYLQKKKKTRMKEINSFEKKNHFNYLIRTEKKTNVYMLKAESEAILLCQEINGINFELNGDRTWPVECLCGKQ